MSDPVFSFGGPESELDPAYLEGFLERVNADRGRALRAAQAAGQGFQADVLSHYGLGLEAMELLHYSAVEAVLWAEDAISDTRADNEDDEGFNDFYFVLRGLAARALSTYAEVTWLLQGGFPAGAYARTRTIHELALTAVIIAEYGHPGGEHPDLAQRYLEHHNVFIRSAADDFLGTNVGVHFDDDTLERLDRMKIELTEKFGRRFGMNMWGWAGVLFADNVHITMKTVSDKALGGNGFGGVYALYKSASAQVHAGSAGWHDSIIHRGNDRFFPTGGAITNFALPASLSSSFLHTTLRCVVPSRIEQDDEVNHTGGYFHAALSRMISSVVAEMEAGEAAAQLEG